MNSKAATSVSTDRQIETALDKTFVIVSLYCLQILLYFFLKNLPGFWEMYSELLVATSELWVVFLLSSLTFLRLNLNEKGIFFHS